MAGAIITRDGRRSHQRAIQLAGAVSMLIGVTSSWAQEPYAGTPLPFCPVYPPGAAPAIGPSNCAPVPRALWGLTPPGTDFITQGEQPGTPVPPLSPTDDARSTKPLAPQAATALPVALGNRAATAAPPRSPPDDERAAKPPVAQATISLRTSGAITLEQVAAMLGPVSKRTVTFALSSADDYKRTDLTHRVRLTWTGSLQALVDQLAEIYGLNVAVDDTAIRFSSRVGDPAGSASASHTP